MQNEAELHDTPVSFTWVPPEGDGIALDSMLHS